MKCRFDSELSDRVIAAKVRVADSTSQPNEERRTEDCRSTSSRTGWVTIGVGGGRQLRGPPMQRAGM